MAKRKFNDWQEERDEAVKQLIVEKNENINHSYKVKPRGKNQENYQYSIETNICTLAAGPAGSGKTFLAVAKAFEMLRANRVKKIFLSRPTIECGGTLGYQPGDMIGKISPYMRPMLDFLHEFERAEEINKLIKEQVIELVPLQFMRGINMHNAFFIIDEAQNATYKQLKLALTRVGQNTRIVINGDEGQSDLYERDYHKKKLPFLYVIGKLFKQENIGFVQFNEEDVVRSAFVKMICKALD